MCTDEKEKILFPCLFKSYKLQIGEPHPEELPETRKDQLDNFNFSEKLQSPPPRPPPPPPPPQNEMNEHDHEENSLHDHWADHDHTHQHNVILNT